MCFLGFSNQSINWFESYFSRKLFRVNIQNKYSSIAILDCGEPQRSNLGPLWFLLYDNDVNQVVDCELFLYVDDSPLLHQ